MRQIKVFDKYKRIVIKIGSSNIANPFNNNINKKWLNSISKDINMFKNSGKEIAIVSSGAVALGKKYISKKEKIIKLEDKQAAAAIGQIELINNWQKVLLKEKIQSAQILLTLNDSEDRRRYLNAQKTIKSLLNKNFIPIINENDTVATEEIRFGDNDRLAARVAQMMGADLLIILTDTDGIFEKNPIKNPQAKKINIINSINKKIENIDDKKTSKFGSGGIKTKIWAAKICLSSGCSMVIAGGNKLNPLKKINIKNSSWFLAKKSPESAKKQWLINSLNTSGKVIIDNGAEKAIFQNKSLLPAGIIEIKGEFNRGDITSVTNMKNKKIGVGVIAYSSYDAKKIIGKNSKEIKFILGYEGRDEIIHKDDLVKIKK